MSSVAQERLVIGIDPGLASTGYGIVGMKGSRLIHYAHGSINTSSKMAHQERLCSIFHQLNEILDTYTPLEAGMETLYFAKNISSAMFVAEARGVVSLALSLRNIPIGEYTPHGIKQAVVGVARADKMQVQQAVKMLLALTEIPSPDHAADALAAAITRLHTVILPSR